MSFYIMNTVCRICMLLAMICAAAILNGEPLDKDYNFQRQGHDVRNNTENQTFDGTNNTALFECLPDSWQRMCSVEFKLVSGSHFTNQKAVVVACDLEEHDGWSLYTYRKWILTNEAEVYRNLPINEGLLFAFEFKCLERTSSVVLPWPIRAEYIWYISVQNCTILDYLAEYDINLNITDNLKVVNFIDSEIKIESERYFHFMTNYEIVSKQFDCGGENWEKLVKRNCTVDFTEFDPPEQTFGVSDNIEREQHRSTGKPSNTTTPADNDATASMESLIPSDEAEMLDTIASFGQKHQHIKHKCSFKSLTYIDESYSSSVSRHHGHFMSDRFQYPALQFYNMSHSQLTKLSPMFLEWRRYFPNMQYLDLSHNSIKYFSTLSDQGLQNDSTGVLDLQHNNITSLTPDDLETLRLHSNTVFVDIRNNPLHCDCKLTHFVMKMKNTSNEVVQKYEYLKHLKCASPEEFKGKIISRLDHEFCEIAELVIYAAPLAVLGTSVVVLSLLFVVVFWYREELMILAFTRLNIQLPCRQLVKNENKIYDAFIAYSEMDAKWVIDALMPRLELPVENNGPGLKLCIHHRDFPIGGSIAENILEKVKDSRHTALILSNNFLISDWCKYEFKTAFSQSILEKKRHLIMIVTEELDKHLIDPDLNRCLKTFTYLKTDDRLFWDKIVYALSDGTKRKRDAGKNGKIAEEDVNRNHVQVPANNMIDDNNIENLNIAPAVNIYGHAERNHVDMNRGFINDGFVQDGLWNV